MRPASKFPESSRHGVGYAYHATLSSAIDARQIAEARHWQDLLHQMEAFDQQQRHREQLHIQALVMGYSVFAVAMVLLPLTIALHQPLISALAPLGFAIKYVADLLQRRRAQAAAKRDSHREESEINPRL